jgi:hypothetical protein
MATVFRIRRYAGWQLVLMLVACQKQADDVVPPERVVQELVEGMESVHGDMTRARAVYDLLWSRARENLSDRASRASAVAGRLVQPEEMIVPSQFALEFTPRSYRSELKGNWATVKAKGDSAEYEIQCVLEDGKWRVVMDLPPLPAIEKRLDR